MQSPREINSIILRREAENDKLRVELDERNSLLSKAASTIQALQNELISSRKEVDFAQEAKEEALRARDELQEAVTRAELMLQSQDDKIKKMDDEFTTLRHSLDSARLELEKSQRDHSSALQKSKEREKKLQLDIEQSETLVRKLRDQVVKLEASAKESEALRLELIKGQYEKEFAESKRKFHAEEQGKKLEDKDRDWTRKLQEVESICERRLRDGLAACEAQFRDESREHELRLRQLDQDWVYRVSEIERGWAERLEEERRSWQRERQDLEQKQSTARQQGEQEATKSVLAVQSRLREALVLSQQAAMRDKEAILKDAEVKLRSQRDQHQKEIEEVRRASEQKEKEVIREKELALMKALKDRDRGYSWRR